MSAHHHIGRWGLSEKEKVTLRLMVRGHDAKSIARELGLSVHTINDRLRDARRKMQVTSSREAARLLFDAEGDPARKAPENIGDKQIGADASDRMSDHRDAPAGGEEIARQRPRWIMGVLMMTLAFSLLAYFAMPQPAALVPAVPATPAAVQTSQDQAVIDAARQWLELLDHSNWTDSYRETSDAFQKLNTLEVWTSVSEKVRVPLGAVVSRTFESQQYLPAPPDGYQVVKFHTSFANRAEAIETVTLEQEGDHWRVAGVIVE
ncbi:MAG: LuxR family transcriptional regulator [Sphingomonas sp.]|nr:LuxR family transcriptional regulator [Sphingomonas sp.]|tara:strand:+ start:922 stop:1710 length:789 start_codon:yes stop_codon:yes gene_type:complete